MSNIKTVSYKIETIKQVLQSELFDFLINKKYSTEIINDLNYVQNSIQLTELVQLAFELYELNKLIDINTLESISIDYSKVKYIQELLEKSDNW